MGCKLRPLLIASNPKAHKNQLASKCKTFCSSELRTRLFLTNARFSSESKTGKMSNVHIFGGGVSFLILVMGLVLAKSRSPYFRGEGQVFKLLFMYPKLEKSQIPYFVESRFSVRHLVAV